MTRWAARAAISARLSVSSSADIPEDTGVAVRSVSAIGEQFVDFQPRSDSAPYLSDGTVIEKSQVTMPDDIGPMLDQADKLLSVVPQEKLTSLVDETFTAFNGAAPDLKKLIESSKSLIDEAQDNTDATRDLLAQLGPLLETQEVSGLSLIHI